MAMTADEIKRALKPMWDFAPALMAAKEIAEAAEKKEKILADYDKRVQAKEAELRGLDKEITARKRSAEGFSAEIEKESRAL